MTYPLPGVGYGHPVDYSRAELADIASLEHSPERPAMTDPADLEHLDTVIIALRRTHQYTSSERVAVIRSLVAAYLKDATDD